MSSRNRTRTSYGFNLGNVYSFGLNKSYGSALGSGGYSFSSGYSSGYSGGGGYGTSFLSRVMGGGGYSGYTSQNTPDVYKRSYTSDNIASGKNSINTESASSGHSSYGSSRSSSSSNRSARLYTSRAKTDSQLSSVLDSRRPSLSSWRSKSTDGNSSYSSRDSRSLSKDVYNNNTESSYDSFREPSLVKERSITRDYSSRAFTPSREYTPSRDYTPARDFARRDSNNFDSNPLPPPRMKKFGFHKSTNNLNEGTNWSGGKGNSGSGLTRSTSFHDLQDFRTLQQQSRNSNSGYFNFRGLENPASDLTRTKSIANIFSPRSWRGSGTDLNTDSTSSSSKPLRLSSLISLTSPGSLSDLGYMSEGPSRRDSLAGAPLGSSQASQEIKKSNLKSQNGEIDYKKLWEASQSENSKLRTEMSSIRSDLDSTRHQLEAAIQASTKNSISDSEKREKKMLEKKLSEMEEELKTLEQLRADNQRLRDENGALIRVISKLSK